MPIAERTASVSAHACFTMALAIVRSEAGAPHAVDRASALRPVSDAMRGDVDIAVEAILDAA